MMALRLLRSYGQFRQRQCLMPFVLITFWWPLTNRELMILAGYLAADTALRTHKLATLLPGWRLRCLLHLVTMHCGPSWGLRDR